MTATSELESIESGAKSDNRQPVRQCVEAVEARYYDGELLPEYAGNPLISALGPLWDSKSLMKALSSPIAFSESERSKSPEYRMHAIGRLSRLVVPWPAQLDVANVVQLVVRQHYVEHRIGDDWANNVRDRYKMSSEGKLVAIYPHRRSHAYCSGIFGLSGAGKSTTLESALRLLPRVIHHPKSGAMQVVWLKIDVPRGASLKDTLKLILSTFDELLGTSYLREVGSRATLADYANKLHHVAGRHYLGLIVLDEMQNALQAVAKSDPLFDFFVNLTNVVQVPVIVSGTPKASGLFRKTLRSARRISSHGVITWNGFTDPKDWGRFCNQLEKYQWLSDAKPLEAAERSYLSLLTHGLPGIAVPLFQLSQYAAIAAGVERLSRKLFKDVFEEKMAALKPMLAAIRSRKKTRMVKYEDLLGDTLDDIVESMEEEARRHGYHEVAIEHDKNESAISAVSRLMLLGVPQDAASSLISEVQRDFPVATSQQLSEEAARRFYQGKAPSAALSERSSEVSEEQIS
ncbi:ATP-binding protein [Paraburkholderia bannensis]|uniref:ATP-binding protein n=1 Tax=Paraburkholderia bannensis TaxID=765414 RepID=UPI002AC34D38|nr:ATP-binding protein [Paraburkholderia bannensis]